jgi:hypothetical protein
VVIFKKEYDYDYVKEDKIMKEAVFGNIDIT